MPKAKISTPDGKTLVIEYPEGTSQQELQSVVDSAVQQYTAQMQQQPLQPPLPEQSVEAGMQRLQEAGSNVGGFIQRGVGAVKDFVTGENRTEFPDVPELPNILTPKGMSAERMSLARGDLGKFQILEDSLGQRLNQGTDQFGNVFVDITPEQAKQFNIEPQRYYLNKAGISGQDFADLGTTAGIEALSIGALGKVAKPIGGALGRLLAVGGGAAGGSAAQDLLAKQAGSDQGVDYLNAIVSGAFGIGGELAGRILTPVFRRLFTSNDITPDGNLSPKAKQVLDSLGVDSDNVTEQWTRQFSTVNKKLNTEQAAAVADAKTLPEPIDLTAGQATRDLQVQNLERNAERGNLGPDAQNIITTKTGEQNLQLLKNRELLQDELGTGETLLSGQGARLAGEQLTRQADQLKEAGNTAYDVAKNAGADLDAGGVKQFLDVLKANLKDEFPDPKRRTNVLSSIDSLLEDAPADFAVSNRGTVSPTNLSAKRLEAFRQDLSAFARQERGTAEGAVYNSAIKQLDDFIEGAFDAGLVTGDINALNKFKEARGIWRNLRQNYEGKDAGLVNKIIDRVRAGEADANIANVIFNANDVGMKTGALPAMRKLKELLGEDSRAFKGIKEEVVMRLFRKNDGTNNMDAEMNPIFSGDVFATSFKKAMKDSRELLQEVFTPQELSRLQQFSRVAQRVTNKREQVISPQSGDAPVQFIRKLLEGVGPVGRLIFGGGEKTRQALLRGTQLQDLKTQVADPTAGFRQPNDFDMANRFTNRPKILLPNVSAVVGASSANPTTTEEIRKQLPQRFGR